MNNKELTHYGVKGMRWGVVKSVGNSADTFNRMSKTIDDVGATKRGSKKAKREMNKMSDAELRARINRIEMERRYSELNPSRTAKGAQRAKSILSVVGTRAAIAGSVASVAIAVTNLQEAKKK